MSFFIIVIIDITTYIFSNLAKNISTSSKNSSLIYLLFTISFFLIFLSFNTKKFIIIRIQEKRL